MSDEVRSFLDTGIYRLVRDGSKVVFLDPVRILNYSYSRFWVSPSAYYSRSFETTTAALKTDAVEDSRILKKRKRTRAPRDLNESERASEKRHQEARTFLLNAHKAFLEAAELQALLPELVKSEVSLPTRRASEQKFIQLGSLWQAPLYEISLCFRNKNLSDDTGGYRLGDHGGTIIVHRLYNNLICNETNEDVEAEFQSNHYILPSRSCFHMSDLRQVRNLVPGNLHKSNQTLSFVEKCFTAHSKDGFNFIVIDPPWENGSACQKAVYPTLPNRYFLYLPVKELAHEGGALVALWMTNREKLRIFVENELFPAWGVTKFVLSYWLKVKPDGSLIGELDLFHHRPYECLLLGYINLQNDDSRAMPFEYLGINQVIVSIPGDYSRKPPLGQLLKDHIPGPKPAKCIELFARELGAGWTSWGNEPLHFQDSKYFVERDNER
ncbi:methyltransferase-like protein 2 isoform X3 [Musa acuminata AAA Group]|uniref:methyltransferase-like protein 2 isoform X3 n=1 Tax=Musa acuminata AAA Group TaxID=214697 RepID=UPI0031D869AF